MLAITASTSVQTQVYRIIAHVYSNDSVGYMVE